jgi:hypothetical protein
MFKRAFFAALALVSALSFGQPAKFSENTVAGTGKDLMIVRHIVIRGNNLAIGHKLAEIAIQHHHSTLGSFPDASTAKDQIGWLRANYFERYERAMGVLEAYGPGQKRLADITSLPIDLDFKPACSVVYYPGSVVTNGHAMMSRNYDFPKASYAELTGRKAGSEARSMTGDPYVIEMYPDIGYSSLYTCAYDLEGGAVDGVNSKGVTVALLADGMSPNRKRGRPGFGLGETDVPRFVLDCCASAKQARQLLMKAPYFATFAACHYMIGDSTGDSFVFEVAPDNKHYIVDGNHKPQIVTNHMLSKYGTQNLPKGNSFDRYRKLQAQLAARKGKFTPTEVKEINYCVAVPAEVKVAATLWHAVYDLKTRSVMISFCLSKADEATQRRTPYLSFHLAG